MKTTQLVAAALLSLAFAVTGAAAAEDAARTPPAPSEPTTAKIERNAKRAAAATDRGIRRAAAATGRGIKRGANAVARGVEKGANAVGRTADRAASRAPSDPAPAPGSRN